MRRMLSAALAVLSLGLPATASAGFISGTVSADAGGAVPGIQVEFLTPGTLAKAGQACTNATGYYSATIPNGNYVVRFAGAGTCGGARIYAPEYFSNWYTPTFADTVPVTDGGIGGVDASLAEHAQVTGTVTRADTGAGIGNVAVEVLDISQRVLSRACSTATGAYTAVEIPPGPQLVRFIADGSCGAVAPYREQFYNGADTLQGAAAVNLGTGTVQGGVDARLRLPVTNHTLTLATAGTGSGRVFAGALTCPAACSGPFAEGTVVPVTAQAEAGSTFAGWSGACTGAAACSVTITGPATVTATFTRNAAATPTPTPTPSASATPAPTPAGGPGATPLPGTGPQPTPTATPAPAPVCTLTPAAKTRAGKLKVAVKCDRTATLTLTGSVKTGRRTYKLKTTTATAAARTVSLTLPSAARKAVKARKPVSATLTLVAKTATAESRKTARVNKLR